MTHPTSAAHRPMRRVLAHAAGHQCRACARTGRGFTLIELAVVGVVSSVLFLLLLRWVLTLGTASSATLDTAAAQRDADTSRDAFAADISRAVPCAVGAPTPLWQVTPTSISFTVPDPADATVDDLITWQVTVPASAATATLERSVTSHLDGASNPCRFAADPATTTTYATRVGTVAESQIRAGDTSHAPAFYILNHGQALTSPSQAWGTCGTGHPESTDGTADPADPASTSSRCTGAGIGINWLILSPTDHAAPISVTRTYQFPTTGGALL